MKREVFYADKYGKVHPAFNFLLNRIKEPNKEYSIRNLVDDIHTSKIPVDPVKLRESLEQLYEFGFVKKEEISGRPRPHIRYKTVELSKKHLEVIDKIHANEHIPEQDWEELRKSKIPLKEIEIVPIDIDAAVGPYNKNKAKKIDDLINVFYYLYKNRRISQDLSQIAQNTGLNEVIVKNVLNKLSGTGLVKREKNKGEEKFFVPMTNLESFINYVKGDGAYEDWYKKYISSLANFIRKENLSELPSEARLKKVTKEELFKGYMIVNGDELVKELGKIGEEVEFGPLSARDVPDAKGLTGQEALAGSVIDLFTENGWVIKLNAPIEPITQDTKKSAGMVEFMAYKEGVSGKLPNKVAIDLILTNDFDNVVGHCLRGYELEPNLHKVIFIYGPPRIWGETRDIVKVCKEKIRKKYIERGITNPDKIKELIDKVDIVHFERFEKKMNDIGKELGFTTKYRIPEGAKDCIDKLKEATNEQEGLDLLNEAVLGPCWNYLPDFIKKRYFI